MYALIAVYFYIGGASFVADRMTHPTTLLRAGIWSLVWPISLVLAILGR